MREGDGGAEKRGVFHVAARTYEIGGHNRLTVARLQCVQRAQPERNGDARKEPSCAQLGLMQKLGKIVRVHS
jgi:hypothetical protein